LGNIVVDTNIVIRMRGVYKDFTDCFEQTRDIIILSNAILKEYESIAKSRILLIRAFLSDLQDRNKLKIINQSRIDAKYKLNTRKRHPSMPRDTSDNKFVTTAIACESQLIISRDHHMTEISPIRWNGSECRVIEPQEYITENCPEM